MKLTLHIWRQENRSDRGRWETHKVSDVSPDMSFLEMLDVLNEALSGGGKRPVSFDNDCREGICGTCSMVINGRPHGPQKATTTCQLHMRSFNDGDTITIEPWRAKAFPVLQDLTVDRRAFDKVIQAGGYISLRTGSAPDANAIPIGKTIADEAFLSAACIGCGACVAACKNASAMLFVSAKVSHLGMLPQGQAERKERVLNMVATMDEAGFGNCTNTFECEAACPKEIKVENIARMNRDYLNAAFTSRS